MNKQSGQISRTLIILVIVILVLAVGVYFYLQYAARLQTAKQKTQENPVVELPKPVYETQIGDVKFIFQSARNLGKILQNPSAFSKPVTTTEKFIRVVVGAQNKGKADVALGSWAVGNLLDSEGRIFKPVDTKAYFLLPQPNLCGTLLKPEFDPIPCMRIYEVSSEAQGLKIQVSAIPKSGSSKKQTELLDLDLK